MATIAQLAFLALLALAGAAPTFPTRTLAPEAQRAQIAQFAAPAPESVGFVRVPEHVAPILTAAAAIAVDRETGAVLYQDHASRRVAIASLNKLMVVLVALEDLPSLDVVIPIPEDAHSIAGTRDWLQIGASYRAGDLVRAALIASAADATLALASFLGDGSRDRFVARMNAEAAERGFTSLSFTNPVGMDAEENFGSAQDVAFLLRAVLEEPVAADAMRRKELRIEPVDGGPGTTLTATNALFDARGYVVVGGKTGTTDEAGQAFAVAGNVEGGRPIISVVLGSKDRFADTKTLLAWCAIAWNNP